MFLLKLLLKLILLPVMLTVTLFQWIGTFLTGFSSVIFYILSGIAFLTAILSWAFQIAPGAEVLKMLVIAFAVFIVPHIGEWFVERISDLNGGLRAFIWESDPDRVILRMELIQCILQDLSGVTVDQTRNTTTPRLKKPDTTLNSSEIMIPSYMSASKSSVMTSRKKPLRR